MCDFTQPLVPDCCVVGACWEIQLSLQSIKQSSPKLLGAECLVYFASVPQPKLHFSFGKFNAVCFSSGGHSVPIGRECILLALTERKTCNVFRKCNCWDSC